MKTKFGKLVIFKPTKDAQLKERTAQSRALHGYIDRSSFGRYKYQRDGFLDTINYIYPIRSVLIVKESDGNKLLSFLKLFKTEIFVRRIVLEEEDRSMLEVF